MSGRKERLCREGKGRRDRKNDRFGTARPAPAALVGETAPLWEKKKKWKKRKYVRKKKRGIEQPIVFRLRADCSSLRTAGTKNWREETLRKKLKRWRGDFCRTKTRSMFGAATTNQDAQSIGSPEREKGTLGDSIEKSRNQKKSPRARPAPTPRRT